jgi:hypothetical protein
MILESVIYTVHYYFFNLLFSVSLSVFATIEKSVTQQ